MRQDLAYAFRALARRPAFTFLAVGLIALGIGLTTAAFDVIDGLLLQPPPFDQPERIVVLSAANRDRGLTNFSLDYPDLVDLQASSRSLAAVAVVRHMEAVVAQGPRASRVAGARVSPAFFRVFGVRPRIGRPLLPGDDAPTAGRTIVLSAAAWQAWFAGQPSVIGRTLALDGVRYTVVGVMPPSFDYPTGAGFWIPFVSKPFAGDRASRYLSAVGRLAPGATIDAARAELRAIAAGLATAYPTADAGWQLEATPIREALVGDTRPALDLAGSAAVVVLLIACANVAGLLFARAAARETELAIRWALGATADRLARQMLLETLLLALAGGAVGAAGAAAMAGVLRVLVPGPIPAWVSFSVHPRTLGFVAAATVFAAIVAGVGPTLGAVRDQTPRLLAAGRGSASRRQSRIRRSVVVAQVTLATALLAGAGLLGESLLRLRAVSPGFDPHGVVTARVMLTGPRYAAAPVRAHFYTDVLARLRALPDVQAAGATDLLPLASGVDRFTFTLEGEPRAAPGAGDMARSAQITPGYLASLRIPVLRGRDIDAGDDATHPRVALVSSSWATRFLPGREAVGQRFRTADDRLVTIVGVVGDVRHDGLGMAGEPTVYVPLGEYPAAEATLVVRAACNVPGRRDCGAAATLAPTVRQVIAEAGPGVAVYGVETMSDVVSQSLAGPRTGVTIGATVALVALLLASAGIYGLMALSVALRRREVAIRLALGARPRDVRWLVLGEGVRLAAMGAALGLGIAMLAVHVIASLLYGVTLMGAPTLLLVGGAVLGVAVLASWIPARRAAGTAPANALRAE